jgi:hypothetical protein
MDFDPLLGLKNNFNITKLGVDLKLRKLFP